MTFDDILDQVITLLKSWELRAATSLARLWQSQEKQEDAHDVFAPVPA